MNKKIKLILIIGIVVLITIIVILCILFKNPNIEEVKNSVVKIVIYDENNNELATGSGFCAYKSNYIVTNYHVIKGARYIKIISDDNNQYEVNNIVCFRELDDLAIISGNFEFKPIKISRQQLKAGEAVTAIGSPKGLLNNVSTGIVSNADDENKIRTTAPISPGSSGGVLLNSKNQVIGVTSATYNAVDAQNINFAISVSKVDELFESIEKCEEFTSSSVNTRYVTNSGIHCFTLLEIEDKYYKISKFNEFYNITSNRKKFEDILKNGYITQNRKGYHTDEKKSLTYWYNEYSTLSNDNKNLVVSIIEELQKQRKENEGLFTTTLLDNDNFVLNEDDNIANFTEQEIIDKIVLQDFQYAIILVKTQAYDSNQMLEYINTLDLTDGQKALLKYCYVYGNINYLSNSENKAIIRIY